ncbi:ABC transporter substrate-binding protein [Pseudonocardia xinjiangensis]|uniref:ABC transporter substrate-binding protein n=1 Tax=Pseudonocardia xinjiangensis TaxID=75289 RepID=UPI003D8CDDC7
MLNGERHRSRLLAALACAAVLLLTACGGSGGGGGGDGGPVELRYSWWGNADRAALMQQAIAIFEADHPDIKITPNFSDFAEYWQKLNTESAGGGTPDVLQMDFSYLREYGDRGLLLDLDKSENPVPVNDLLPGLQQAGVVDGQRFAVALSGNTWGLIYDPAAFQTAGVSVPERWTWEEYGAAITKVAQTSGMAGAWDYTSIMGVFEIWLRQQGKALFTEDGRIEATPADLERFWQQGVDLRAAGAFPPQDKVAQALPVTVMGADLAASAVNLDSMVTRYAGESDREFALGALPSSNPADLGIRLRPGILLSAFSGTDHPRQAAQLIDFMVNDPRVGEIFGGNRGLPASNAQRAAATPKLSATDAAVAEYEKTIAQQLTVPSALPPAGVGTADSAFLRINEELAYGRISVQDAAAQWFSETEAALR